MTTPSSSRRQSAPIIPDTALPRISDLGNSSIHEIVFALRHADDDQAEDAQNALITAKSKLESLSEILERCIQKKKEAV